ncbi:cytochrome c biogenesis protein CcdA [Arthrobacter sp. AQ5-05]|uniref:cytochrome c biogenesis CcdA family protein n=1 Tax=Arthrobacter sp. AQ5-05 TaxID=2184581 RepID=UPI000DCDB192|nr:cytochrome c biogenesis CcdA family protein [Arthrobacter sp. AQ5-05]RAX49076.1 cytochrome c biogenesis protein CcdA [Arthrobacter sp. AQ5-05]
MEAGLVFAFAGGVLGLFSPCNAMLLPAFFAHAATSGRRLRVLGLAFLVGMLATLVPLGLGIGWLGGVLSIDRRLLLVAAAWVIIALGLIQILGGGFDLTRLLPARTRIRRAGAASPWGAVLLGTVAGVAGFCTGPVLGAILTLILANGSALGGGMLLASYALGMVLPVLGVAAAMRRAGTFRAGWLRGRTLRMGRFRFHTNALVAGTVTITVGILMLTTGGLLTMPDLLSASLMDRISDAASRIDAVLPGWAWPSLLGALLLAWWIALVRRTLRTKDTTVPSDSFEAAIPADGTGVPAKARP